MREIGRDQLLPIMAASTWDEPSSYLSELVHDFDILDLAEIGRPNWCAYFLADQAPQCNGDPERRASPWFNERPSGF
jgi:hypothetical protein